MGPKAIDLVTKQIFFVQLHLKILWFMQYYKMYTCNVWQTYELFILGWLDFKTIPASWSPRSKDHIQHKSRVAWEKEKQQFKFTTFNDDKTIMPNKLSTYNASKKWLATNIQK